MLTPQEVHAELKLHLGSPQQGRSEKYRLSLASVADLILDETPEAIVGWFDYEDTTEVAVHVRVLTPKGLITLDHEFAFDGSPDARLLPWSRVQAIRVIARTGNAVNLTNAWFETELGTVEFAGARSDDDIMAVVRTAQKYVA